MCRWPLFCVPAVMVGVAIVVPIQTPKPGTKATTYATDIAPILNRSCVPCHRTGEVAPFSLIGYENAKKWSPMIAAVTEARRMPPWKAKHGFGEFLDANRLTDDEIAAIKGWHEAGAPRGDAKQEREPPTFTSEWPLGQPNIVLQASKPFTVPAEGDDVYRNFVMTNEFKEPVWVKAMAIKPGNPKVVHHVITFIDGNGQAKKLQDQNGDGQEGYSTFGGVGFIPSGSLGGWAPGLTTRMAPHGTAMLVKPGSTLVVQVHYHPSGKPETDLTRVGLYLAKEKIEREMNLDWIFNFGINIPAGESQYKTSRVRHIPVDVTLYGAMPHMHLLGRSMKAELELPDGSRKPLVWIDDWDFNWQMNYAFKEPIRVPKGSKIHVEAVYDNSAGNPRNPSSPPRRVTWGEQTTDEMFLLVLAYTADDPNADLRPEFIGF